MCQVLAAGALSIFIFPSPDVHGVCMCIHSRQTSSWTRVRVVGPQVVAEVSGGWGICAGIQWTHDFEVSLR